MMPIGLVLSVLLFTVLLWTAFFTLPFAKRARFTVLFTYTFAIVPIAVALNAPVELVGLLLAFF